MVERSRPRAGWGRRLAIVFAGLLVVLVLAWAFQGLWLGTLLRHYVMAKSGRSVQFDDLHVGVGRGFDPTVTFRNLTVQNAPWAERKEQPLVHAGLLSVTVAWRSLFDDQTILPLIVVEDADLDMERQADGLRNWRVTRPDDRGPPRVRVLAIDARRSRMHTIQRGSGLEGDA